MFRQVKEAAGKCPAWQSVVTDGLRGKRKPSGPWFNGVTSLLPVWREGGGKGHREGVLGRREGTDVATKFHVVLSSMFHVAWGLKVPVIVLILWQS